MKCSIESDPHFYLIIATIDNLLCKKMVWGLDKVLFSSFLSRLTIARFLKIVSCITNYYYKIWNLLLWIYKSLFVQTKMIFLVDGKWDSNKSPVHDYFFWSMWKLIEALYICIFQFWCQFLWTGLSWKVLLPEDE